MTADIITYYLSFVQEVLHLSGTYPEVLHLCGTYQEVLHSSGTYPDT